MPRYRVLQTFNANQLNGPCRVITTGAELVLLRWMGEEHERSAIFAVTHRSIAGLHGPAYEVAHELFETSTEQIEG